MNMDYIHLGLTVISLFLLPLAVSFHRKIHEHIDDVQKRADDRANADNKAYLEKLENTEKGIRELFKHHTDGIYKSLAEINAENKELGHKLQEIERAHHQFQIKVNAEFARKTDVESRRKEIDTQLKLLENKFDSGLDRMSVYLTTQWKELIDRINEKGKSQ